ncbi:MULTISPECIES: OadG family protein [unclassified Neptuniibacter]|jgi:oxaloacetate decarboxylase gamma subunit|uniref:OadG family protein n=1 Tax=unclassified Neptuniibacter TaxID=2630693 RepID=UPI0026E2A9F6|nr:MULTISPECIES: OadG family protein [unclassified Neptuniibacter]MDO6515459.1 OadG family protein [Neptuniibacter sp. 2_MG-2023]MDO6595078.1 OadG family protein [Neptuniibacter sp. 1_MG-2023]
MENLLSEGLELMAFGMGFVFVFLTLLVFTTSGMSKVVSKYFPEAPAKPKAKKAAPTAATASNDELIAVMTAAVHKYRS